MCIYIMMYVCVYICIYTYIYIYIYIKQDRNEITVTTHLPLVNKCLFVSFHASRYLHLASFETKRRPKENAENFSRKLN